MERFIKLRIDGERRRVAFVEAQGQVRELVEQLGYEVIARFKHNGCAAEGGIRETVTFCSGLWLDANPCAPSAGTGEEAESAEGCAIAADG